MPRGDKPSFHKSDMFLERSPTGKGEVGILASGRRKKFVERKRSLFSKILKWDETMTIDCKKKQSNDTENRVLDPHFLNAETRQKNAESLECLILGRSLQGS